MMHHTRHLNPCLITSPAVWFRALRFGQNRSLKVFMNTIAFSFQVANCRHNVSPHHWPEKDGEQNLYFCWIDPIEAATRMVAHSKFRDKLYTQFEPQHSEERPNKRVFGRANSGFVFQAAQAVDPDSSPLMLLFYADKSFSGQHRTHHPIYSECM